MTLDAAFAGIRQFWPTETPFAFGHGGAATRLSADFGRPLPPDLVYYLDVVAPADDVDFDTVGNPLTLYGLDRFGPQQPGYSFDTRTRQPVADWRPSWFLLADEGADPVVLDLAEPEAGLQKLVHGAGNWQTGETVADTLGQFLLCSAALHHALTAFEEEVIIDDAQGFNLAPQAAAWLLPRLKAWAGPYYEAWAGVFDNA